MKNQNKPDTIIFIFRSCGNLSGTERVLLNWCRFIDESKINIIVCAHRGSFWEIYKQKVPYVQLLDFHFDNGFKGVNKFIRSLEFFRKLNVTKVVWLLNGMGGFDLSDMLAAWLVTEGNMYISHHSFAIPYEKAKPRLWFGFIPGVGFWRIARIIKWHIVHLLAKRALVISQGVKDHLAVYWKLPTRKMRLGCRGVDTNVFYPDAEARKQLRDNLKLSQNTKIFIALNRFTPQKMVDRLLGAFLKLLKDNLNVFLLVAGEGYLKDSFQQRLNQNTLLKKHVKFLEFQINIIPFLQGADFLLLSSDYEGEGNVIKEAMACSVIPISTDSYGPRGIKGTVFLSKINVFSFYKKIKEVLLLKEEELSQIRQDNINIVKATYEIRKCATNEVRNFDVPIKI